MSFEINNLIVGDDDLREQKKYLYHLLINRDQSKCDDDAIEGLLNMIDSMLDAIEGYNMDKTTAMRVGL